MMRYRVDVQKLICPYSILGIPDKVMILEVVQVNSEATAERYAEFTRSYGKKVRNLMSEYP